MVSFRTLRSSQPFYKLLKNQTISLLTRNTSPTISSVYLSRYSNLQELGSNAKSFMPISIFQRNLSTCAKLVDSEDIIEDSSIDSKSTDLFERNKKKKKKEKKHLNGRGNAVVRKCENLGLKGNDQNTEKKKIGESLKIEQPTVQPKPTSLHAIFTSKPKSLNSVNEKKLVDDNVSTESSKQKQAFSYVKPEPLKEDEPIKVPTLYRKEHVSSQAKSEGLKKDKPIRKDLSPEMTSLIDSLFQEGYLKDAKILGKELDIKKFFNNYSRCFVRHAAEKFGQDHQEIAKWLSGSDLKTVALFGCPSVERKTVFAAKQLRSFFNIQEDNVCRSCQLKSSCNFVNQKAVVKRKNMYLVDTMRVLTSYSIDMSPQLVIPKELKSSIDKLLKDVVRLSQ